MESRMISDRSRNLDSQYQAIQSPFAARRRENGRPRTNDETAVTADTALRLSKAFGTTAALWLNLQNAYDVQMSEREIGKELKNIEPIIGHAA